MSESARLRPVEPDEALERLLRLTRETLTDESWPAREGELRRLQDRLGTTRPRIRWSLISALSALAVMLPAAWLVLKQPSALTFEVIHGTVAAGGEIRPLDTGTRIQFSDGSQVVLDDGARTQVRDLAADGARIVLSRAARTPTSFRARMRTGRSRPAPTSCRSPARCSMSSGPTRTRRWTSGCTRARSRCAAR